MTKPTFRERMIAELLDRYQEFVDPCQARSGTGDGVPLPLSPSTYTPSVKELERLLVVMRETYRPLWWHTTGWYDAPTVQRQVSVTRRTKNGRKVTVLEWHLVRRPRSRVNKNIADEGVRWLAASWTASFEPELPREVMAA